MSGARRPPWTVVLVASLVVAVRGALPQRPAPLHFAHALYNVSIAENSVGRTYAVQPSGEDPLGLAVPLDGELLEIRYKIIGGDKDKFFKAEDRLVGDFCFLSIRTRTGSTDVLNRERKDKYVLEVRATASKRDGKNKVILEVNTTVHVTVIDTNDLNPLFYPTEYSVTVPEDTPLHKSIIKVTAEDADLGINGEIYYSFAEETEQFAIHPTTGVITITQPLVFTDRSLHELVVLGEDRGALFRSSSTSHTSRAKVTVSVRQVNLFAPEIYVHHLPDIVENSSAEIYAIVRILDKDEGIHGKIKSLEIVDGDPDGHFRIQPAKQLGEYNIIVHQLLDREKTPHGYNLTLRASDMGTPMKQSYKSVPVHLADLNDNAPVFNREIYEVSIPETAPVNTPVIRLKVTDKDQGKNAQVFLEIVGGNEGGEFYVNPDTGMLYTAVTLDAESKAFYTLTVSAIDQGNTGIRKQSSAKVKINILDTNDNDPLFDKPELIVWIDENEPTGTSVTKVTARDKDAGENAYISYSIANLNPVPFEIDHFSGVIKTTQVLDYESMKREFILRVRASDWGLPYRRQTEMQLTIKVKDINDNRPQFEKLDCIGYIPRYIPIGSEIITLSAIDFDAGNIISYRIISGNEDNCFNIDTTSGVLSISCDLKDIRADEREVNITATDGTHFADVARIILHLINAKKTSSLVGRILTDDSGSFECRDTGVARRLTEVLAAAERNNMPGRDVNQEDFAMMPSRYGENVHTPEFLDFPLEIKVNESVPLGTTLTKLKARDRDLGYNGKLIFGISSGDQDSVFRIDPETGDLKIIGYLDRERESEYYLNITVYDLGKPQKSVSRVLPITVLDVNDNAPKFEKSLASFRVTENALNGTSIFKVNATDIDSGEFAKITYNLVTDTNDFFVDTLTGILVVSAPLDRERQSLYELRIRAKDNGGLYSDALVRVSIDDINDNAPQFTLSTYNFKVREDVPRGTVVAIINAVDYDLGSGGEVKYSIVDEGDLDGSFKIDPLSGTLRTATLLDFEERQVHSLTVRATDQGLPSLYSETSVIIEIVDVNENLHAPVFSDFVLEGSVSENKPVGTKVFVVKATDADPPGGDSRITYSIIGGNGMGYFTIDNQGQIRTLAILDVETTPHYWLTVCAQDQGVVPLHSCVQVYIRVENENDIVPLTEEAIYHASIPENSPGGRLVLRLRALDGDADPAQRLSYKIVSGNPEGLFSINSSTGEIVTTGRRLDRESQEEHSLEVQVSDGGRPTLASTTRVVISLQDLNDNAPRFLDKFYSVKVPATAPSSKPAAFQVLAHDEDAGANGDVTYSIKSGKGKSKFHIHPKTGVIVSTKDLDPGSFYELNVRATDGGSPARASTARVSVAAVEVPRRSPHAPRAQAASSMAVAELDEVGFLVAVLQATDEDGDALWYDIVGGDTRNEFYIGQENGNILLAKKLVWEVQNNYTLNISITDGTHVIYTPLNVSVVNDINEKRPNFEKRLYVTEVSEGWFGSESNLGGTNAVGEPILSPRAEGDGRLLYGLHASRSPESAKLFKVDTLTGAITVKAPLDRETMEEHLLTISVRDQALRSRRDYTRVLIKVHDKDDHAPEFSSRLAQARVFANAPVGAAVARVRAFDRDKGNNAEIYYSITGGNVGGVFSIDAEMGDITLSKELDASSASEYMLHVKASNPGPHPLSASIPVHIMVTMADNSSPRFSAQEVTAEMYENEPPATFVKHLEVQSTSSVLFEIIDGNVEDAFGINPSTGVIVIKYGLDYETLHFYNLTVMATNMGGASATCSVVVHVLDKNDNAPTFLRTFYNGSLPESAPILSLVLMNSSTPLVIATEDLDSEINALRSYEIMDAVAAEYFNIDSTTGAVKTIKDLDHETIPQFEFNVKVIDMGKPRLTSDTTAKVIITVLDVNDCPPKFEESVYNATLILPTYKNVAILTVRAHDQDTLTNDTLKYDIIDGDKVNVFAIDSIQGVLTVVQPEKVKPHHRLHIRVSDGKYSSTAKINIKVEESENSGLVFQKSHYEGSIVENSTKIVTVAVLNVLGSGLNEHVRFRILNPTDMFTIGLTSGAIQTTGKRFDREVKSSYMLIVEARSIVTSLFNNDNTHRVAHVKVNVTVMDVNDNCPMFVNLPYYAVVSVDDQKGQVIAKVHAIDDDINENGEVRYEMKRGHGELFKVCRRTGEISLKQNLEGHNKEYQLIIGAYDGGVTPCYSEATVYVKVVDRSMPVFDKQFYHVTVPENIEVQSPIGVPMQATSPLERKLIYTIIQGNDLEEFSLDFNTAPDSSNGPCILYAAEELDYETQKQHDLVVRATDSVSGVHAEVSVTVSVTDVNDCPPVFPVDSYNVSVSEGAPFGSMILKVEALDNDTDINKEVKYVISDDSGNASIYFHIDPDDGSIYLKQSLDREVVSMHHFTLVATDKGFPPLSSTVHVWINVQDMNDNPPRIEQPVLSCVVSEHATRGQFIAHVAASDADIVDTNKLNYAIVGGNDQQTFSINSTNGIITLVNMQKFGSSQMTVLNVSVSDGVYTAFSRVKIGLSPANKYAPQFQHVIQEAIAMENQFPDMLVTTVKATDDDFGDYGVVSYSIPSKLLQETFSINSQSGELTTLVKLDRERTKEYEVPIMASDGGGRLAFTTVRVKVGDENDNPPIFLLKEYKAAIHSNITIGGSFLRLKAVDADDGMNSKVEYSIYETADSGINDIFSINPNTGTLSLLDIATSWESQVFQFWIRATDKGNKPLHTDVPVEVYIMASSDNAPVFERNHDKFFLPENSPRGTVITRLKLVSDVKSQFRILPGLFDPSLFTVDGEGQLILSGTLNREDKDSHLIGIVAETLGSPPLTSMAEVTLNILDENDHAPVFHSSPYVIALAENVEPGTSVLKVIAVDRDSGTNGEIRYALSPDSEEAADTFSIDPYTGWITTLVALDRETKPEHKFQVLAMDNAHMKQITRTTVVIRLRDYNDCPPVFKQSHYKTAINEDALPGTIIIKLETTDKDYDEMPTDYYIVSGDPHCQFQIRQTGEVYVIKQLDRETIPFYNLEIIVSDGRHTARTRLSVVVLDTNDNPPYCLRHRYRHTTSENLSIGSYLLTVLASDADEPQNAKLRYYLSGDHSDHFSIDKESGELKTAISLDRERQWKYQLIAHIQDREKTEWECHSEIEIIVSDVNDNAPQFSMNQYSVTLPEDVEVGTLVTKVHATDNDIGINRKIRYSLIDDLGGKFKMTPDSGIVTLGHPLDRETKSTYTLEVKATDQGNPSHWTQATILLTVSDINDNPPEFANKYYFAIVPEIDAIGTEVVRVLATSKDTGVNADVYYSIIGGNEHEKFTIDSISGVISIAQMLDYERAKEYFLTIQAIDGGIPPLSNLATINITVTDSNDNAPIFTQSTYNARIREDAQIGDKILQVIANDYDSESNGRVTYSIERGDRSGQFVIDTDTGYISVAATLDRETQSSYVLEVHARDHGLPVLTNFVLVNVDISDANDNPPLFSQSNYTAVVQEDKPLGFMILKFIVHDADDHPNAAPYTFDFQSGNEIGAFRLEQDGFLRTAAKFNHKIKDQYTLQVRVFDNGTPPLYSDAWVIIKVIEESQYPPVITPLEVSINSFLDEYPGGEIGKVYSSDQDTYDTLSYSLAPTNGIPYPAANLFRIDQTDGTLVALPRLDIGDYRINVTVSDGKFLSSTIVKVSVELISEEMLANAVIVRFREVNEKDFVVSHRKGFVRAVRNAMNSRLKDVIIISVQPSSDDINFLPGKEKRYLDELQYTNSTDYTRSRYTRQIIAHDLDVLFAVRKSSNQGNVIYHTSESIRKSLNANLEELEESTKLVVEEIVRVKCGVHFCAFGECQEKITLDGSKMIPIAADFTSLVCPVHQYKTECRCHDGYGGDKCETIINACARTPCPDHMKCFADQTSQGYNCQCVDSFKCDVDSTRCYGENCFRPTDSVSFGGKSYAQYRVEKGLINGKKMLEDQLTLSLRFRTMYLSGTLMYAAGRIDYNILEVVNGVVQYRLELGTGECVIQVTSVRVSDNRWHEVRLERNGNSARVTVDGKHIVHGSAPGTNQILNLYSDNLFIGAQVRQHPAILGLEDVQRGFVGCMGGVHIAMEPLPLRPGGGDATKTAGTAALVRLANVEMGCPTHLAVPGACSSLPCLNGGTCKDIPSLLESSDNNSDYQCQCHERFSGRLCELDTDPCASQPCLYGGICTATSDGEYTCTCPDGLRGRRCEVGRWCGAGGSGGGLSSNGICAHGGVCEEGDWEPSCRCHGYYGSLCQFDIDECQGEPCLNGATCINEPGSFRCVCPPDKTGMNCGNPLYSDAVTAGVYSILGWKWEHLAALGGGLCLLLVLAVSCITVLLIRCKRKARRPKPQSPQKDNLLNSVAKPHEMQVLKRGSKLSNLEVQRSGIGGVERPVSYAPVSTVHDSHHGTNNMVINNLDTLRSYGSAGDELENFPPDYRRNLNLDALQNNTNNVGDNDSLHKPSWSEQMHLQTFQDHKINNDLKGSCNTAKPAPPSDVVISPQRGTLAGYHWDCSDWCNTGMGTGALPNITEVPGSEVPDSSSLHSDESNTSRRHRPPAMVSPPPLPQIQGVEEESPYAGDEDEGEITDDVYQFNNANSYLLHPNTYLPHYTASSEGETGAPDDPEPYGFPPRRRSYRDDDIGSVITMLEERNSLLGAGSTSDLSTNLCEIEESDCENDPGKLGKHWTNGVQHTDV